MPQWANAGPQTGSLRTPGISIHIGVKEYRGFDFYDLGGRRTSKG